ncbi:hypothetical protein N9L47_03060 [Rhodobacteraceae bacterium]|nr:hypothetical protein [Paracoccaceae bacterium]
MKSFLILTICTFLGAVVIVFMGAAPSDQPQGLAELDDVDHEKFLADLNYVVTEKNRADLAAEVQMSQEVSASIRSGIEELGGTVIDPDRFTKALFGDSVKDYLLTIKEYHRSAYLELFTPDEITALANYYRSENGQNLLTGDPETPEYAELYAFFEAGPGAPFLTQRDALIEKVEEPIRDQMVRIEQMFSMSRVADFIERPDLIHFEDESRRKAIVEGMRELN